MVGNISDETTHRSTKARLRSLPEALAPDVDNPYTYQYEPFQVILSGHFLDCQETMYWHFLVKAIHGRVHGTSNNFLHKGLMVCVDRIQQNQTGFYNRHHGTWLMLRSCARSALVLLATERNVDLVCFLPIDWEGAVCDVSRMLEFWKHESNNIMGLINIVQTLLEAREN
jgi:hypothetical protein